MGYRHYFLLCATLASFLVAVVQSGALVRSPPTRFTCQGRASGYYADVETGCQVYHMCDGLGRQFSYSCPNTTLFQQRMLVCDHWYMVNCTNSESDYDANLLIGQRDKPFVSEADMRQRTPRPDILTVPPNSNYYDGLKEAETKFPFHPDNSIVGISESISSGDDNDLDSDKRNYRPPTSWSMKNKRPAPANIDTNEDNFKFNNRKPKRTETVTNIDTNEKHFKNVNNERPTFKPTYKDTTTKNEIIPKQVAPEQAFEANKFKPNVKIPSKVLLAPLPPTSDSDTQEYDIDARLKTQDPVYNFIKRFDPNSPDSIKTSMTRSEIIDINKHLPDAQVSSEEDRLPRNNKNFGDNFNVLQSDKKKKGFADGTRFETVNIKPESELNTESKDNSVAEPARELLPPKSEMTPFVSTTMGPPIYYEWKWAVPAFDLEPPKFSNETNTNDTNPVKQVKRPFSDHTTTTPKTVDIQPMNTEYNTSSYFIPDFVFPLDRPHPGYDDESAQTSFQVEVSRPGRASYGENPACPHCHPAYLTPGTCEPCIVKR